MKLLDFLLEINVEDMPSGYVRGALFSLRDAVYNVKEFSPDCKLELFATKNLLICYIKNLNTVYHEIISGPPQKIAFNENGEPTKQAIGFAKKYGVDIKDLKIGKDSKIVIEKTQNIKDLLKGIVPGIIKNISFPKTMRWDDSGVRFARPVKSVLCLFGKNKIQIQIGNIPNKKLKPITPAAYLKYLEKGCIIDHVKRKEHIRKLIEKAIKKIQADYHIDGELLEEVAFMVNFPEKVFIGDFRREFLDLPSDVLRASMSKHQRVFPVSKNGKLINKFIAVVDGAGKDIKAIRGNYEKILDARLKDSLFFLCEDQKKPFQEQAFQLKTLIFQQGLGNMAEKISRLKELCLVVCEELKAESSLKKETERAAELSKIDLVTHMVGEFPSLQGIMGGEYALLSGEKKEVALAIKEHYLPQGAEDALPETTAGAILALCDKVDNLVGFAGIDADKISGSYDPYGIRRNALGIINIIKHKSFKLKIDTLIQKSIELYGDKLDVKAEEFKERLIDFLKARVDFLIGDIKPSELKKAVLDTAFSDIQDVFTRIEALASISKEQYFLEAAKVVERASNILKTAKGVRIPEVNSGIFKEEQEHALWNAYLGKKGTIKELTDKQEYIQATKEYGSTFYKVINDFFNNVLVNTEDEKLRLNRFAIMKAINNLYTEKIADLAMLPRIQGGNK